MLNKKKINRRQFLKKATAATAGAIAFPYIVPSSALGKAGNVAASNRITLGFIGVGRQSHGALLKGFLNAVGTQVVAACDVDKLKLKRAQDIVENHYADKTSTAAFKGCAVYNDFRDLLARNDIDAVVIVVPDHWHSIMVELAARAGKDIYCEKPLSLTISEAKAMVEAVDRYGTGS
jgi:predicted dehydrogenase